MAELLTAEGMRRAERAVMESGRATGLELMERAGRGVVDALLSEWPDLATTPHRAVVLCGPGNNGGDGFVIARLLRERGWQVDLFLMGDPAKLPPDARANHDRWTELGAVRDWREATAAGLGALAPDLFVDALFGTGLARGLPPEAAPFIAFSRSGRARVVAVDVPSGLCSDSGRAIGGEAMAADLTVTFHAMKTGHVLAGDAGCGRVAVAGIGIPAGTGPVAARTVEGPLASLAKGVAGQKYDHGHALVLSGGPGRTGAARLAARGALRIGAGLVTVGCPPDALPEVAAQVTAIMCRTVDGAGGLSELLEDARLNALCLGPALGLGAEARALVLAALAARRATVLDADALTLFRDRPDALFEVLHAGCVLTPHGGEFARLFPDIAERLAAPAERGPAFSRIDAAREAAARAGCTVLLKGPATVIADPEGRVAVHASMGDRAVPWLATAGSGDVLAGFIAGLLARGFATWEAAATAAWCHAECARLFGPGLIAEDIPEVLPRLLRGL